MCLIWLFLFQITAHTYLGTKTVATRLEFWNLEQATCYWNQGECNQLVPFTRLRWGYYSQVKNCAHLSYAWTPTTKRDHLSAWLVKSSWLLSISCFIAYLLQMPVMIFTVLLWHLSLNCFWKLSKAARVQYLISSMKLDFIIIFKCMFLLEFQLFSL